VLSGEAGEPAANERILLGEGQLAAGIRLACQVRPLHDLTFRRLLPAAGTVWRPLVRETPHLPPLRPDRAPAGPGTEPGPSLGVAVDLGTTHLSVSLLDLTSGTCIAACRGRNPQAGHGADVITRLVAAAESAAGRRDLRRHAVEAIGEALASLAIRTGAHLDRVVRLTLVGNTAMLALLSGRNFAQLLEARFWAETIDCLPLGNEDWASRWGIHPSASIRVLPPLAGFVGSDLLAGVAATGLTERPGPGLLVDFGTNSEVALWTGSTLWAASAAGGPAFEGSGLRCGMVAEKGAIARVVVHEGVPTSSVIGGGEPLGICGTGLVDLVAELVRAGTVSARGRFAPGVPAQGYLVARGQHDIVLTRNDVDVFQRAKAGIGAAIDVLMRLAGLERSALSRLCISGAFGTALDVANAQRVGLVPEIPRERVELCGNTALAGCELALLDPGVGDRLAELAGRTKLVNLASCPEFDASFLEQLHLRPAQGAWP
jgi:uncharacterized 2Fe-2S/4Fe-4S cluster protein (DUF4445 family)